MSVFYRDYIGVSFPHPLLRTSTFCHFGVRGPTGSCCLSGSGGVVSGLRNLCALLQGFGMGLLASGVWRFGGEGLEAKLSASVTLSPNPLNPKPLDCVFQVLGPCGTALQESLQLLEWLVTWGFHGDTIVDPNRK